MKRLYFTAMVVAGNLAAINTWGQGPEETIELTDMTITASRREAIRFSTPDVVQVIDRKEIEALLPENTGELFEYTTGTSIATGTGSGLPNRSVVSLNGLPPQYTMVLVDGVPLLTDHMHTGQNLDFIPPAMIERIEIVRGAASAQYGANAIGGIVNIITRKCTDATELDLGLSGGSFDTYKSNGALLTPLGQGLNISCFADWEESDGQPVSAPTHRVDNTGFQRLNVLGRIDAHLGEDTELYAWLNYVDNTMDWRGSTVDSSLITPVAGINHAFSPGCDLMLQVSYSDWEAEVSGDRNQLLKPEANMSWALGEQHTLLSGGDYQENTFERNAVEGMEQQAFGLYLQDDWIAAEQLTLMVALRYDEVTDVDEAFSPKLSMLLLPQEPLRIRFSIGNGFHAPSLQELYEEGYGHGGSAYRFGNPDLESESSTTYTLGLEGDPNETISLAINGFYSDLENMIVPVYEGAWVEDPSIDVWRRQNIKNAEVYGAEASAAVKLGSAGLFETGYTYTQNEDADSGQQLPYSPGSSFFTKISGHQRIAPELQLSGYLGLKAAFDREAWNWKPASGAASSNIDGMTTALNDYTQLNCGITLSFTKMWDLFFKVENILGEEIEYLDDVYTVMEGEPFYQIGLKYHFASEKQL